MLIASDGSSGTITKRGVVKCWIGRPVGLSPKLSVGQLFYKSY